MKKKILIFIPALNLEKKIFSTFSQIPFKLLNKLATVKYLIINDNSKDRTDLKIKKILNYYKKYKISLINNKKNLGYGGVQKLAFEYAIKNRFNFCIMLHGDGQYKPRYLPRFIKLLLKYCHGDITQTKKFLNFKSIVAGVFGSRMIKSRDALKGNMPLYKFVGNKILTYIQNLLLSTSFSEFHSGYRSYDIRALKKINYNKLTNKFYFDTEIILELLKKNFSIKEFPIKTYYGDEVSHVKSIPYGLNILRVTLTHFYKYSILNLFKIKNRKKFFI